MSFPQVFVVSWYTFGMSYIRKVTTTSGATAIQVVRKQSGKVVILKHVGSANSPEQLDLLLKTAQDFLHAGQLTLFPETVKPLDIIQRQAYPEFLWQTLSQLYDSLGFSGIPNTIFRQLVIARIIEPSSKLDTVRIIREFGIAPPSNTAIHRCLDKTVANNWRQLAESTCFKLVGPSTLSLILYDVTTLYFEAQKEDEFRKPGISKERRLEPQIVIGLLVDRVGFPLAIHEFEGNKAETKTMLPVIQHFLTTHNLTDITITADAGMLSSGNLAEIEKNGLNFIIGSRLAKTPYELKCYSQFNRTPSDGEILETKQDFMCNGKKIRRRVVYQYREKRARLDLKNIDKQVKKAESIVSGKVTLKKAMFLEVAGQDKKLNQKLVNEHKARAGWKGYVTNLPQTGKKKVSPLEIINNYHQLFQVEKSFRMSKHDLKARPIYHYKLDSIRAHLTIVFVALAMARIIEARTGMSLRKFLQVLKPIKTGLVEIGGVEYETKPHISDEIARIRDLVLGH